MDNDRFGHDQDINYTELFEALASIPGDDPILLAVAEQQKLLPPVGWFVRAQVAPGAKFIIDIYRYGTGALRFDSAFDTSARDGKVHAKVSLRDFDLLTLAYKDFGFEPIPDLESTGVLLPSTIHESDLEHGRLLVEQSQDAGQHRELVYQDIESRDISWFVEHEALDAYDPHIHGELPINRVTEEPAQLLAILNHIGRAANMTDADIDQLLAHAALNLTL